MKKKPLSIALVVVLSTGVMIPISNAEENQTHGSSIEQREVKTGWQKAHPVFSWNNPGPLSPVLHNGSARGAGMVP